MDMTLSKRGDYVMRSAIALARAYPDGTPRKIRQVVADTEVPQSFASQILADLVRAGLATSRAGRDGGYRLSREPAEITVLEVIEAAEGPLRSERCALGDGPCRWDAVCPLHETWSAATVNIRGALAEASLAELARRDEQIEAGLYATPTDAHRSHPVSVDVADSVQVELGTDDARQILSRLDASLPGLVAGAVDAAAGSATGPPAVGLRPRSDRHNALVPEASLAPVVPAGGRRNRATHHELSWRLGEPAGAATFDAEVTIAPVDDERCQVEVAGTWRQSRTTGPLLARDALERYARAVLRAFLRSLARALEEPPAPRAVQPRPRSMTRQ